MEPTTDAQTLAPALVLTTDHNLLNRVEAPSGLHLEKYELVPHRRDALRRDRLGLQHAVGGALPDGVQLERTTPIPLPEAVVGQRHVEDVRHASGADDVVVIEQMAALAIGIDRHVPFHA